MSTDEHLLNEIRLMARADHAYRLSADYNPYPPGSAEAAAWLEGWQAEQDAAHKLDEEMSKLPEFRVQVFIVEDADGDSPGTPLVALDREQWGEYTADTIRLLGNRGVIFQSKEARMRFPAHDGVAIRVDYENPADA